MRTPFAAGSWQGFALVNRQRSTRVATGFSVEMGSQGPQLTYGRFGELSPESYYWQLPQPYLGDKVMACGHPLPGADGDLWVPILLILLLFLFSFSFLSFLLPFSFLFFSFFAFLFSLSFSSFLFPSFIHFSFFLFSPFPTIFSLFPFFLFSSFSPFPFSLFSFSFIFSLFRSPFHVLFPLTFPLSLPTLHLLTSFSQWQPPFPPLPAALRGVPHLHRAPQFSPPLSHPQVGSYGGRLRYALTYTPGGRGGPLPDADIQITVSR